MALDDIAGKIKEISKQISKQMESNIPSIDSEIDAIIRNKERSVKKIEGLLDTLLDYMNLGVGETEFKKLNAYYESFNKENADVYDGFYQELKKG
ncbi:MAG: hypothetical protein NTZ02_02680 [Candidatus Woesearchaeota archaeon]|nr:hypothetical protein [Candidatus Woesearchaeota archaeon]